MIWLIGDRGMLGQDIARELQKQNITYCSTDVEVDITDLEALRSFAKDKSIRWIINAAAYTAVDKAESDEERALAINGRGTGNIGRIARELDVGVIHFSTDYVFDGEKEGFYQEDDQVNPVSAYGRTKLAGEIALREATPKQYIIRISWLYGHYGPNFVATMLRFFKERDRLGIVDDQYGAPTWTRVLAQNVVRLVQARPHASNAYGVYHYSDEGCISWFEFACAIFDEAQQAGLVEQEVQLDPIGTVDYPTPARRPANSAFDKTQVRQKLGFDVRPWRDNLKQYLSEI